MRERLDKILEQLKELNEKIGKRNRRIIIIVTVLVIAAIIVLVRVSNITTYEVLYTGLSSEEQVEILGAIQTIGVDSKSTDDGEIQVPEGQADSVRAQLALQGYPKSGMSYDIFTSNVTMTSTDFEKETYKLYELQDRLSATIKCFSGVRDATVTIAVGETSNYVLASDDSDSPTTASVTVIMKDGGSPSKDQVKGIQNLVSSSVPGMTTDDVTIIDGEGNDVSNSSESSIADSGSLSDLKVKLESMAETSIKAKVLNLLEPIYGEENVRVAVNCTVDIDKKVSEALTYYPSADGNNSGVLNSEGLKWESIGSGTAAGGVVGTESNSEVPTYPYTSDNAEGNYYSDSRTYDYLVSQLTEQVQKDAGQVSDTNVSVVIGNGSLTAAEIQNLTNLVAVTAGIDQTNQANKVAIMDTRFATTAPAQETAKTVLSDLLSLGPVLYIIIGALVLLLIILGVVFMLLRSKKKNAQQVELLEPEEEEEEVDWNIDAINLDEIKETKEQALREQIREFASQNPEITASLIKNWLKEEEV